MKSCNFCITRAGASTLAELFISNIPFLTIPLPNSKDNHQYENAMFYKRIIVVGFWMKKINKNKYIKFCQKFSK